MRIYLTTLAALLSFPAFGQVPGVTAKSILLGQSAAFSGPAAQLGIQMNIGTKAYLDHINAQGGVYGRKIALKTRDDRYEANLCADATTKLIEEDKVFALISYVGTPTTAAAMPIITKARVPLVGPFTGAELLRTPVNRYIFNVRASYYDETEKIVDLLVSNGNTNIAVFYQDDNYGLAGLKGVEIAMAKRNLKISALGKVERNTIKVEDAVKSINAARPGGVVMISAYTSVAEFVRQMKKAGSITQFYNVSFVGSKALADALKDEGYGITISQVVPFPWSSSGVRVVKEYQEIMARAGSTDFNFSSLEGLIVAKVMVEGLKRAGKDLTRERLIAALESMNNVDLGEFVVSFSPTNHSGSKYVNMTMIGRGGRFLK
ncbi:MAG: ABC transporter substrate-binding protein [Betaproteobacteria bacterium]|nr:MAG: ABC transporter substrate-binding protein [Betaproteobacteria bacterium]TMG77955.1 MAG: ABC transporter substrate-binding protein [Betaproteobacteria bacterium]